MTLPDKLKLHGTVLLRDDLEQVATARINDDGCPAWEADIYRFIADWLSPTPYVTAHTSGSTGKPKPIRLQKKAMVESAKRTCSFFNISQKSSILLALPATYIAGKMMIVRAFVSGADMIMTRPASNPDIPSTALNFLALTPHQFLSSFDTLKKSDIDTILLGGSAISAPVIRASTLIDTKLYVGYGMTETCSHVALWRVNDKDNTPVYRAMKGVKFTRDERDCLVIHDPLLLSAPVYTNDIVELKDETCFCYVGRADEIINSGGVKIHPEILARRIEKHVTKPFFIYGEKDELLGEKMVLVLEDKNFTSSDEKNLLQTLKSDAGLEPIQVPKKVKSLSGFIYTNSGKIDKQRTIALI